MPRRTKDKFQDYNGKHKYVSVNFNRDNSAEITTPVELDEKTTLEIKDEVDISGEISDATEPSATVEKKLKEERRERIKKAHPDRGGDPEELKKILAEDDQ
jgi:hypothetical protein